MTRHATASFFVLLVLLFGSIALGNVLRTPEKETKGNQTPPKEVTLFQPAVDTAFVTVPGKIRKETVIHIVALTPGIVSDILTSPGRAVVAGQTLFTLTGDYQSGSASLQKQLATESDRLAMELGAIDKKIHDLEAKRIKQDDGLSDTEADVELMRLKKEQTGRKSTLEQSALSLRLSMAQDAVYKPKTATNGVVQSITVRRGDVVAPGKILATLSVPRGATTLEAFLDPKTARLFDATQEATLTIGTETLLLRPTFFSRSENEQGLFSVLFTLSEATAEKITNGEFLKVALPLKKGNDAPLLVPIDAVFQDDRSASVLKEHDGRAEAVSIVLGTLHGSYAEVRSGLSREDRIILNRSVISGEAVSLP